MTRVAVVQTASIPFDSDATVSKAEGLIADDRVLLAITPNAPQSDWIAVGLD